MKTRLTLILLALFTLSLSAQQRIITGTVTSSSENSILPGVNVTLQGTTKSVQTDFNGKYEIRAKTGDILEFSFVSMITQYRKVEQQNVIDVEMQDEILMIEELEIEEDVSYDKIMVSSPQQFHYSSNYGLVSTKQSNNGNRTDLNKINRTESSKNTNEPLYIVDGIPIEPQYSDIVSNFKKEDIDKLDVLQQKEAKQAYGNIAKHGCIVITTVRGNYRIENDESYAQITENKFERTSLSPLSTFSIDVDKAAYSNIRRMINNGQTIPVDAVKIEEMINYFSYDYPQPTDVHPFSINTEAVKTPWNSDTKLVRIGLQGKTYDYDALPPSNLTFLIDVSGSMSNVNKLPLLKSAFKLLVNQLRDEDRVSIVVYAGAAGVVLNPTSGNNKEKILEALDNLQAGGPTAGGQGIELAYKLAEKNFKKSGNNRVILATDGDFNVGESSDRAMEKLIEEKRKSGVFLSVLGFGYGNLKDSKLETLADKGNGNHAYIDTMQEAQKMFGEEFGGTLFTIAKDVKIQVEFNPVNVQAYRLIGYENRFISR